MAQFTHHIVVPSLFKSLDPPLGSFATSGSFKT